MTNEELAEMIGKGGNDDLLPVLWEQTQKYFRMYADKYCRGFRDSCDNAGVTADDIYQECYFVLIEGIRAYNRRPAEQAEYKLISYFKYPMRTHLAVLLGYRRRSKDCLNCEVLSLNDEIVFDGEADDTSFVDVIVDPNAEHPFKDIEDRSYCEYVSRYIRKVLAKYQRYEYEVINRRYFRGEKYREIAKALGMSAERIRQIEKIALNHLRRCYEFRKLAAYSPYKHVGLENFKHNGSVEEQFVERKERDEWKIKILESVLMKG